MSNLLPESSWVQYQATTARFSISYPGAIKATEQDLENRITPTLTTALSSQAVAECEGVGLVILGPDQCGLGEIENGKLILDRNQEALLFARP
jgi:hypothetical protein